VRLLQPVQPEWQKLATKLKGSVKVAYWDTAQGNPPPLIGQIKGTPTVKFIAPHKKNKRTSNKRKSISDYNGERKLDGMLGFAIGNQPNYATSINSETDLKKFMAQADKYALPKVLVVSKESSTSPVTKYVSTEFRRRALVGTVRASKPNKGIIEKYGLNDWLADKSAEKTVIGYLRGEDDFPMMKKKGKFPKFTIKSATTFLNKFALDKPYFEHEAFLSKQKAEEGGEAKEEKKEEEKEEKKETKQEL